MGQRRSNPERGLPGVEDQLPEKESGLKELEEEQERDLPGAEANLPDGEASVKQWERRYKG